MSDSIHKSFERAFKEHFGKVFDIEDITKIILAMYPTFNTGSIIPTDHAEHDHPVHTGQCRQCTDRKHQIFDTLVEGNKKHFAGRYRVRMFEPFPNRDTDDAG